MKAEETRAEYAVMTQPEKGSAVPFDKVTEPKVDQGGPLAAGEFTYVDISSVDNKLKRITEYKTLAVEAAPSRAKQRLKSGDVLVSMTRPNLNAVAIVPPELDGAIGSTGFHVLRATEGTEPHWLYYAVQTKDFISAMSELVQGALYPAVRPKDIRAFEIPHPPLDQQKRIVAKIEKQFSRLDEAVANLKRVKANLKRYKAAVLKAAVEGRLVETEAELARREGRSYETGEQLLQRILETRHSQWQGKGKYKEPAAPDTTDLPELPEGWTWASAEQLAAGEPHSLAIGPFGSNLKVHDYTDSGVPLVFVRNIRSASFGGADTFYVTEEKASELKAHRIDAGDLLITKMGDPPGDVCIYPMNRPPAVITADCIKLRFGRDSVSTRFCAYAIESECVHNQILGITKGVAQLKVSLGRFSSIGLPLPPITEQHRIVAEVDRRLSLQREAEAQVDANLHRAERLRQSILAQAFSGRLKLSEESVGEVV